MLLGSCRPNCKEVRAVSPVEAAIFQVVRIVRCVACYYKVSRLQEVAVSSTDLREFLHYFTKWGEEKFNSQFPDTKLLTALKIM